MSEPNPLGRVVATERKPNTPHEFHFWTALDSAVGIGTIVRVEGATPVNGRIPEVYGIVVEGFSYTDLQTPLHDVMGHDGSPGSASLAATHAVVAKLSINGERTGRAASGLLLATDVADYLVSRGMPFRRAHEVVGAMVRRLLSEGRDFSDLTMAEWRDASDMFGEDAPRAATALASVQAKRSPQSTNPDSVRAALGECREWIRQNLLHF